MHAVSCLLPVSDEEIWLFLLSDEESPRNLANASSKMWDQCTPCYHDDCRHHVCFSHVAWWCLLHRYYGLSIMLWYPLPPAFHI